MGLNLVTRDINTRSFLLLIIILAGALAPLALAGSINHSMANTYLEVHLVECISRRF